MALIDTGADEDHEALSGKILALKDFVNNQTKAYDDNGHGTHCASLISGPECMGTPLIRAGGNKGHGPGRSLLYLRCTQGTEVVSGE